MHIGTVARKLGTDPPTIRYYEEAGVLPRPARGANRYREYRDADVRRIELVLALRRLDVPLHEIRTLAGTCFDHRCATNTERLLDVVDRRSRQVHEQIDELHRLADRFAELRRRLSTDRRTSEMTIDARDTQTTQGEQRTEMLSCDCGCVGSGCTCGCTCCGAAGHAEHESTVEVLAQVPETACDCGCCG